LVFLEGDSLPQIPGAKSKERSAAAMAELAGLRTQFREQADGAKAPSVFSSRVGVVLSGGGARGAYEAGVLMAFSDAKIPTHILAATSIGSINAASYAAHSEGLVGKADSLVKSWMELTPAMLGIDWSRYVFTLAGLVAASAGIGNLVRELLDESGIYFHTNSPKITWFALAAAGVAILLFADKLSYVGHLLWNLARRRPWDPDHRKIWISLTANVLVWGFVIVFLNLTHIRAPLWGRPYIDLSAPLPAIAVILLGWLVYRILREPLSRLSHRFLRLPLRTGLFANFERTKFLRARIPVDGLRNSSIRVVMTATDLNHGVARFFSNTPVEVLAGDPGANKDFVLREFEQPPDLVQAAVASSSYTFAYEAVPMDGRLWTDGGVMTNQPILPALRLGADLLFLVMIAPLTGADQSGEIKTFLDVGVQAVDIMVSKNFKSDIMLLDNVNRVCTAYATELGLRPEQVELEIGKQRYHYVKSFSIAPEKPLPALALDFDAEIIGPIIVQGYRDAMSVLPQFLEYEAARPTPETKQLVRLAVERPEGNFRMTTS
jgi:predicted acylesterase/phospholipase RssA